MARRRKAEEPWIAVKLGDDLTLILGWRPRPDRLEGVQVDVSEEVAKEMRQLCTGTLTQLDSMIPRPYKGYPQIEEGEEYLRIAAADLAPVTDADDANHSRLDADEAEAASDLQALVAAAFALDSVAANTLRGGSFLFYAVVTAAPHEDPVGFVKLWNPRRGAKEGRLWTVLSDAIRKLDDPVFIFENDFDLVVTASEIAVLRQLAFERLFADMEVLPEAVPRNLRDLKTSLVKLPLSKTAEGALMEACLARRSLAKRLQRLTGASYLSQIDPTSFASAMKKYPLNKAQLLKGRQLAFSADEAPIVLDLLEQLYYVTDFSKEPRRADRYSSLK